jgi:hypothetical protein
LRVSAVYWVMFSLLFLCVLSASALRVLAFFPVFRFPKTAL